MKYFFIEAKNRCQNSHLQMQKYSLCQHQHKIDVNKTTVRAGKDLQGDKGGNTHLTSQVESFCDLYLCIVWPSLIILLCKNYDAE